MTDSTLWDPYRRTSELSALEIPTLRPTDSDAHLDWSQHLEFDATGALEASSLGMPPRPDRAGHTGDARRIFGQEERVAAVREALTMLGEEERTVLTLFYFEGMNVNEIASILDVTEARISEISTAAVRRVRSRMTCPRSLSFRD